MHLLKVDSPFLSPLPTFPFLSFVLSLTHTRAYSHPIYLDMLYIANFIHQDKGLQRIIDSISKLLREIKDELKKYADRYETLKMVYAQSFSKKVADWITKLDRYR